MSDLNLNTGEGLARRRQPHQVSNPVAPSLADQSAIFDYAHMESSAGNGAHLYRQLEGPTFHLIKAALTESTRLMKQLGPGLRPEHLTPSSYRDKELNREIAAMPLADRMAIDHLRATKAAMLALLSETRLSPDLSGQVIPAGILDTPPYAMQGDCADTINKLQACGNASFRMVMGAILGWLPNERVVEDSLLKHTGSRIAQSDVYGRLMVTDVIQEVAEKKVTVLAINGADFSVIKSLSESIKARRSDAEAFTTVSIGSPTAGPEIWHSGVLVSVDENKVVYHDPSRRAGGYKKVVPKKDFIESWAIGLNRAQLVITRNLD